MAGSSSDPDALELEFSNEGFKKHDEMYNKTIGHSIWPSLTNPAPIPSPITQQCEVDDDFSDEDGAVDSNILHEAHEMFDEMGYGSEDDAEMKHWLAKQTPPKVVDELLVGIEEESEDVQGELDPVVGEEVEVGTFGSKAFEEYEEPAQDTVNSSPMVTLLEDDAEDIYDDAEDGDEIVIVSGEEETFVAAAKKRATIVEIDEEEEINIVAAPKEETVKVLEITDAEQAVIELPLDSDDDDEQTDISKMIEKVLAVDEAEEIETNEKELKLMLPSEVPFKGVSLPFEPYVNESKEVKPDDPNLACDTFGRLVEKKYSRRHWYAKNGGDFGANFMVMSGERLDNGARASPRPTSNTNSDSLYGKWAAADSGKGIKGPKLNGDWMYGRAPPSRSTGLLLEWGAERLDTLETLDIQKNICGALNSRLTMSWMIGVDEGVVTGCPLDRASMDLFANAFSHSVTREFVPDLDPNLLSLDFHLLADDEQLASEGGPCRYVIEIGVTAKSNTVYQLSSGRVFTFREGVLQCENLERVRRIYNAAASSNAGKSYSLALLLAGGAFVLGAVIARRMLLNN
ncbi:unnamed protein product, partial [Mesorhabditis spiculigera]